MWSRISRYFQSILEMKNTDWLALAQRIQSIAQAGIFYTQNPYDKDRYEELSSLSVEILHKLTDEPIEKIAPLFTAERDGYQTPKVDIRAVVFNEEGKLLFVREKVDGCWSLPGGWADVGYSPAEVAVKEVREESGIDVKAVRLLGVFDKKFHNHPPEPWYVYKLFLLCEQTGGQLADTTLETSEVAYFGRNELPPLSLVRNTESQVMTMFSYLDNPEQTVYFE